MRILLIVILLISSTFGFAKSDKAMEELFEKYDVVMRQKKVELLEEVFTDRFIQANGGKAQFADKIKGHKTSPTRNKSLVKPKWRKGLKGEMYFVEATKMSDDSKKVLHKTEFIIIDQDGKLKIDGTLSDAE
jgi:cytochrome oxidase Cu insertion factor (SCO1/SenC/PrrC family)